MVFVKLSRFRQKLAFAQMMLIDDKRADDSARRFGMMKLQPGDELVHFAARARTGAKDEDLAAGLQDFSDRGEKAVRVGLFPAPGKIH